MFCFVAVCAVVFCGEQNSDATSFSQSLCLLLFLPRSCLRAFGSAERARIACFSDSRFFPAARRRGAPTRKHVSIDSFSRKSTRMASYLTAEPHPATSDRNNQLADFIADEMAQARM